MPDGITQIIPVIASEDQILAALAHLYRPHLTEKAETRVAPEFSCRNWQPSLMRAGLGATLAMLTITGALTIGFERAFSVLCIIAICCLFLITLLKFGALCAHIGHRVHVPLPPLDAPVGRWPRISVMVPLYRETEIATALTARLRKLTYPRVLLDVSLVLEEKDDLTRQTLQACDLPDWIRVVEVPGAQGITTKPRALNYALDFCRGEIIGIWDAEDAPAPDQLQQVAAAFARAGPDVVCLQGILDYYNPRANWIARCFTIKYAAWFRVILPGLARLGLVLPLGGTTLFLRRDKIHELGGWDAHNVTEDADLGVRIARFGYRTEVLATPTHEEANCRPWRWVKQRSRWLKGFMVTYCVHMRAPRTLLRDLGWRRFLGLQAFFVGTLSQFLFAPLLWSFWAHWLTLSHPAQSVFDRHILIGIGTLFVVTELVNLTIAGLAVARRERRFLLPWTLTMPLYFPMGAVAAYKALYELIVKPYYWDKTQHGQSRPDPDHGSEPTV